MLANPQVGVAYSQTISTVGGSGSGGYILSLLSGTLPTGLTFVQTTPTTGVISGTPTAGGNFNFTIQSTNIFVPCRVRVSTA